jgi:ribosomal protein L37E
MAPPGRLSRFLHLERARPAGPTAEPPREGEAETQGRIANLERPAGPPAGPGRSATGARLERFGPEPEPALELLETEGRRPFTRCRRCGADSHRLATACQGCGASLDTPEQHEFDEQFWAQRQAEADREAQAEAERKELRTRAEAEEARERQAAAEALAREVGDAERRRLGRLGIGGERGPWEPLGLRLIRRVVPDERWHPLALGAAAGAAAALCGLGVHLGSAVLAVTGGAALVALLVHAPQ